MPISSQVPIIGYVSNGVTKSFAFPFAILSADDLKVKVGADVVTTGFSIAGVGDRDGGSVTFTDAPASLTPIILYREVTLDRTTDYQENGDLLAIVLDDDLDRIWMALQDQLLLADRALRSPIGETLQQLPPASERALMALAFDAAGNPIVVRGTNDGGAALALDLMDTAPGKGAVLVGYDDGTAQDVLDEAKPMANYTALRAYTGRAMGVRITQTGIAGFFQRDAGDTTSADNGGTIIVDGSGRRWKRLYDGAVQAPWWGAVGNNTADDSNALEAMFATGLPWEIPYTASGYKISRQLTINASGVCHGFIKPTTAVGASASFVIAPSGYATKRYIKGLRLMGDVTVRAAGVRGIQVDAPNAVLELCGAQQLDYGLVVRAYSVTLRDCHAHQCNTNLSAYARSFVTEINALTIDGGQYDSAVNVALNIGDTSWPDALAAGNSHGVVINIINGVSADGAESRIDNVGTVNIIGTYAETTNTDCLWRLGGAGDGFLRNVIMRGNHWKSAKNAVRCYSGVEGLTVGPNFLSAITQCEVKLSTDIYGVDYTPGVPVGSFSEGQPVGVAFRSLPIASVTFDIFSLRHHGLINGAQYNFVDAGIWYPGGTLKNGSFTRTNRSSTVCSFLTTPSVGISGVAAGDVFTFTTKADCYRFNGGQRVTTSPAGAAYVRSVDYDAGTMILDAAITSGAAAVSHAENYLSSVTFGTAAPTSGTWKRGDICENLLPSVGAPKRWLCTADGTPGTWVSEGNL